MHRASQQSADGAGNFGYIYTWYIRVEKNYLLRCCGHKSDEELTAEDILRTRTQRHEARYLVNIIPSSSLYINGQQQQGANLQLHDVN